MAKIYLVRHGKAAAGFDGHPDPGLDALGRQQAAATAAVLAPLGPLSLKSSPLARARETALPLAQRWGAEIIIEPRVAEIPSPTTDLAARAAWLRQAMQGRWRDLGPALLEWRDSLVASLVELPADTVIVSHYVAINAAVGVASNDDRMVIFAPDNASVTVLDNSGGRLGVLTLGASADTFVN
ncbi:MAG: histidine phosphatase family protein [Pseudomonadales bacterium]